LKQDEKSPGNNITIFNRNYQAILLGRLLPSGQLWNNLPYNSQEHNS